jgi:ABC-2 type transport system permease protein
MVGRRVFRNLFELFGYVVASIICSYVFIVPIINLQNILILLVFVPITFTINHFVGTIVGSTAFFIDDKRDFDGIGKFWLKVRDVTTGSLIPLTLLPIAGVFTFLPTSFVLHHPMQIYLGKYSTTEIIYTFVGGITWCFVLWILARVIFKLGLKKNEAVGL